MLLVHVVHVNALAQGSTIKSEYYNNFALKEPKPSGFGQFGNTKINYYTGLPEVSYELISLQGRDLSLPVTIGYDASGIKTDELSGQVGMKWSLLAGGFVVRNLNNLPDEDPGKGYWKSATDTKSFTSFKAQDWVTWSEKNEKDGGPDEFALLINGRSIRFFIDKDKKIHTVPRQNVKIEFTMSGNSINGFIVTLEDGVTYVFGGTEETIEKRTLETLTMSVFFESKWMRSCPTGPVKGSHLVYGEADYYYYCEGLFDSDFYQDPAYETRKIDTYSHKWWLRSIKHPSGETLSFDYEKLADVKYVLRPSYLHIGCLGKILPFVQESEKICSDMFCIDKYTVVRNYFDLAAAGKFTTPALEWMPGGPPVTEYVEDHFNPLQYAPAPGTINMYHTLVTENNTRLKQINAANGNRVQFVVSKRSDLPGAVKYDQIKLLDMNGTLIKSLRLNYEVIRSNENNDLFWPSEAMIMRRVPTPTTGTYYADYIMKRPLSEIPDGHLRTFVYEGLKEYNYLRTFLKSIEDITDPVYPTKISEFEYSNLSSLRRRTTTYHDIYGYFRNESKQTLYKFATNKSAAVDRTGGQHGGKISVTGLLTKITYPMQGSTQFNFVPDKGHRLKLVQDLDEDGNVIRQREIEYIQGGNVGSPIVATTHPLYVEKEKSYVRYRVVSSRPLNDNYAFTHGSVEGYGKVKVYNGTEKSHSGFDIYEYTSNGNGKYIDVDTPVVSIPPESSSTNAGEYNIFPFPQKTDKDHLRGLLLAHEVYETSQKEARLVSVTRNDYAVNPEGYKPTQINGFKGGSFNWKTTGTSAFWFGHEANAERKYRYGIYHVEPDWVVLAKTSTTVADDTDEKLKITNITEFVYDKATMNLKETRKYLESDSKERIITRTKYSSHADYQKAKDCQAEYNSCAGRCGSGNSSCIRACENDRLSCQSGNGPDDAAVFARIKATAPIDPPIEVIDIHEKDGVQSIVKIKLLRYMQTGIERTVVPKEIWEYTGPSLPVSKYASSYVGSDGMLSLDGRLRKVFSYDSYSDVAKVTSQTSLDGTVSQLTWGYNDSYVKEERINPGPAEQKTTYNVAPMVGLTSITDLNGVLTSYRYDKRGRLIEVTDRNGKLISRNVYHYPEDTYRESLTADIKISGSTIVNQLISFNTATETRPYGSVTYFWDLGDGVWQKGGVSTQKKFTSPGTYKVRLKKTHPVAGSAEASVDVTITSVASAVICVDGIQNLNKRGVNPVEMGACTTQGGTTILNLTLEGACVNTTKPVSYSWQSSTASGPWVTYATGPTALAPQAFLNKTPGFYQVRCVIDDSCGNSITSNTVGLSVSQ